MKRRDLIKGISLLPLSGGIAGAAIPFSTEAAPSAARARDLYKELGVRTFINAAGTYTFMTGSLMREEVLEAIRSVSSEFCLLDELQDKVGERISKMVHSESAVVTAGAFSGLTLGLAGILTGDDPKKVPLLPFPAEHGMKSEVISQKAHDIGYNHALKNTGCKMIMVETREEMENAINDKTAMLFFLNIEADKGLIKHEEFVEIGKKHGVPTGIDIAADVPPVSNLWKFNDMGFDFVVVSGGKAIRGPQSAGILMGKKHIIDGARMHMPPRGANLGRGMKVNKEEIFGMYVALDEFMSIDHDKKFREYEQMIGVIADAAKSVKGVSTRVYVPELGNITPTLEVSWDPSIIPFTTPQLQERLRSGNPSVEVMGSKENSINITVWVMRPGQEKIVARKLKEALSA